MEAKLAEYRAKKLAERKKEEQRQKIQSFFSFEGFISPYSIFNEEFFSETFQLCLKVECAEQGCQIFLIKTYQNDEIL
jgi:hypothetical protein